MSRPNVANLPLNNPTGADHAVLQRPRASHNVIHTHTEACVIVRGGEWCQISQCQVRQRSACQSNGSGRKLEPADRKSLCAILFTFSCRH